MYFRLNTITMSFINEIIGSFMGAFFAFCFFYLLFYLEKSFEKKKENRDVLEKLTHLCNEYSNIISDNNFVIKDFCKSAEKCLRKKVRMLYKNKFTRLLLDREIPLRLINKDLKFKFLWLNIKIRKINQDIDSTNDSFREITKMDYKDYEINVELQIKELEKLRRFLNDFHRELVEVLSIATILMKRFSFWKFLKEYPLKHSFRMIRGNRLTKVEKKEIPAEIERVNKRIKETETEDQERINKILVPDS